MLPRKGIGTELEEVVHTLLTLCRSGWLLTPEYFLPSQWIPVLASVYSLPVGSQYLFTLYLNMAPNLSNMRCSISEISAVQLCSVTEIAPKSLFLCVNRSLIRYGFRSRARATILDKTVEKIAFLGGIFSKLRSRPILPFPPPPGSSVVGSSKESRIPKHL